MEMTRQKLMQLLDELIEECHTRGIEGTIAIYGGTAMVYYVPELRTTQDVDSMFRPFLKFKARRKLSGIVIMCQIIGLICKSMMLCRP